MSPTATQSTMYLLTWHLPVATFKPGPLAYTTGLRQCGHVVLGNLNGSSQHEVNEKEAGMRTSLHTSKSIL